MRSCADRGFGTKSPGEAVKLAFALTGGIGIEAESCKALLLDPGVREGQVAPFLAGREAVRLLGCFCEVRFPVFSSWPSARIVLSKTEVRSEIYGRFMGGSDRNRSNSGQSGQCVQHMQIVQSRINIGDFASR